MKIKHGILFCGLLLTSLQVSAQQDDQLSQYTFNPLSINPACAGSRGVTNLVVSGREQWTGFEGAPKTAGFAVSTPLKGEKMALGFRLRDEKDIFEQKLEVSVCYAYRLKLLNGHLAFGISAGVTNTSFNWYNVNFKDSYDVMARTQPSSVLLPRFDAGLFFNNSSSFIGGSATHLYDQVPLSSSGSNYSGHLMPHIYFMSSKAFVLNDQLALNPTLNCQWVNGVNPVADVNLYACFKSTFWVGAGYRTSNSLICLAQVQLGKQLRIGYSYDISLQKVIVNPYGTHEIVLGYDLNLIRSNALSFRYF
jgi:type IX secretion system PorP/SprF family membrane protein